MIYGSLIKKARSRAQLTQEQLAKRCGLATITIRQYESGKREPRKEQLEKIAKALEIPFYELMGYQLRHDTSENREIAEAGFKAAFGKEDKNHEETDKEFDKKLSKWTTQLKSRSKEEVLLSTFAQLNDAGKDVAIERVQELLYIPKYWNQDNTETQEQERNIKP